MWMLGREKLNIDAIELPLSQFGFSGQVNSRIDAS